MVESVPHAPIKVEGAGACTVSEEVKEQCYRAEMAAIAAEIKQIEDGTYSALIAGTKELGREHSLKLKMSAQIRDIHLETAKKLYRTEDKRLTAHIKKTKSETRKRLISEVESERDKCRIWFETAKIDSNGSDGDLRGKRQLRRKRDKDAEAEVESETAPKDNVPSRDLWPIIQLELESHETANDLLQLNKQKQKSRAAQLAKDEDIECFYEHKVSADERNALADRLRYDGKWYYRFHKVTVEFPDAPKITGIISMLSPIKAWLRCKDASQGFFSVSLADLTKGRVKLRAATGREN